MTPPASDANGSALDAVLAALRCPACHDALLRVERTLACGSGHRFDLARQGYVNLAVGRGGPGTGDSPDMVAARERVVTAGVLDGVVSAVVAAAAPAAGGIVLDLAGGPGHYAGAVLDAVTGARGIDLDLSAAALRRASRAHPRLAAVGADAWGVLPLRDGSVGLVLTIFGPRHAAEIERVLRPSGRVVVVTPTPAHLAQLRLPLGLPAVDPDKDARLGVAFGRFVEVEQKYVAYDVEVDRPTARDLALMGPLGKTTPVPVLDERAEQGAERTTVTVSVRLQVLARPGAE